MREGNLEAPTRHALLWRDPDFADRAQREFRDGDQSRPTGRAPGIAERQGLSLFRMPAAGMHIRQGMEMLNSNATLPEQALHPIERVVRAYGLARESEDR